MCGSGSVCKVEFSHNTTRLNSLARGPPGLPEQFKCQPIKTLVFFNAIYHNNIVRGDEG